MFRDTLSFCKYVKIYSTVGFQEMQEQKNFLQPLTGIKMNMPCLACKDKIRTSLPVVFPICHTRSLRLGLMQSFTFKFLVHNSLL